MRSTDGEIKEKIVSVDIVTLQGWKMCVERKSSSYLSKLFEILLHIFHYRVGRQAAHKYFLCSCDHLEKRERDRGRGQRKRR